MHRFFVPQASITSDQIIFPTDISHQICRVLRLRPGERVIAIDEKGIEYEAEIAHITPQVVRADICNQKSPAGIASIQVDLFISLCQREKFEWILQKCCEAGAYSITPFISSRTIVQDPKSAISKLPRWQKILREAAEQCGRIDAPIIYPPLHWKDVMRKSQKATLALMAWERERSTNLHDALAGKPQSLLGIIGPEGGFSSEEVQEAQLANIMLISLGPRTLRMETAAVVFTALVMHELEKF